MAINSQGQALLEWVVIFPVVLIAFFLCGELAWHQYQKYECSKSAFELTRRALEVGGPKIPTFPFRTRFILEETPFQLKGTKICGELHESVQFYKLR